MIERNARETLKQWAEFVNAHQGKPLTPKDLNQAIEFYRLYPWLDLEVRRNAKLASIWPAALRCSLLPNLRNILMVEAERKGIDPRPLVGAFDLLAKVGEAVEDLPRPEGEQPDNARWPDEFYGWPDSYDETLATLGMDARRAVREAEAIFEWLRVKDALAGERLAPGNQGMVPRALREALNNCSDQSLVGYAKAAGVRSRTKGRGGAADEYSQQDVVKICDALISDEGVAKETRHAAKALVGTIKPKLNPN